MKTRLFIVLLTAFLLGQSVQSKEVSLMDAKKAAINYYYERVNQYGDGIDYKTIEITNIFVRENNGLPVYYAFDLKDGGFIIISGDDAYTPVIGYSYKGSFPSHDQAYVYASFMQGYADMIEYIREKSIVADETTAQSWATLLTDDISTLNTEGGNRDVAPLADFILWDQNDPYNLMAPADAAGPGGHCYAGCVATAMSMIMYYYRYPTNGTNDHTYSCPPYGNLSADFENTYYQWDGMQDEIDNHYPMPIAELQYHCGVSVNMQFSPSGSGSYSYMVPNRLDVFWRYEDAQYLEKSNYSQTAWINLLKAEIDLSRPLYYSGSSTGGGHAFLCDGYQGDEFHFNFGWSGSGNGFYTLSNVGGFYIGQACVRNFYPSDPDYPYYAEGAHTITHMSGSFTDGSGPIDDYINNQSASWLIDPQNGEDSVTNIKVSFTQFDLASGDYVRVYDGPTTSDPLLGEFTGSTLPSMVTSTGNKVLVTFDSDASGVAKGFTAAFETTSPVWCVGLTQLEDVSGTFDDGSGSFYYNNGATCMWRIQPQYASVITLYFNSFDTEEGYDVMKIFDGSTQIASFSGSDVPDPVEATSGSMFVTWSSNSWINGPGWEVYYEINNVGVEEPGVINDFLVFPNPARNELNIAFNQNSTDDVVIRLMSMTGEVVIEQAYYSINGVFDQNIDLSQIAGGVYILTVTNSTGMKTEKIVIE
ncbi:MAG: C10 family peptidase [Bacteroidetes bacterium]|nr:C10 family peptidase [Bacteroidota bacterium]